jgi:hypothetical protein
MASWKNSLGLPEQHILQQLLRTRSLAVTLAALTLRPEKTMEVVDSAEPLSALSSLLARADLCDEQRAVLAMEQATAALPVVSSHAQSVPQTSTSLAVGSMVTVPDWVQLQTTDRRNLRMFQDLAKFARSNGYWQCADVLAPIGMQIPRLSLDCHCATTEVPVGVLLWRTAAGAQAMAFGRQRMSLLHEGRVDASTCGRDQAWLAWLARRSLVHLREAAGYD